MYQSFHQFHNDTIDKTLQEKIYGMPNTTKSSVHTVSSIR